MSYIPKYILKRMVPKDAVKLEGDKIVIDVTNVISPINIDEIPDNVQDYLEVKLDGETILSGEKPELFKGLKISWEDKEFTIDNIKDAIGLTIPVGGKLRIEFPNSIGVKSGEEHEVEVIIKADNPINIKVKRTIQ